MTPDKIRKAAEEWYRKWTADNGKSGVCTINVLTMLQDYALYIHSQQPQQGIDIDSIALQYSKENYMDLEEVRYRFIPFLNYLKSKLSETPSAEPEVGDVLELDNPWPLKDVLLTLSLAADKLLKMKNYDGPDYEEIRICVNRATEIIHRLELTPPQH